MSLPKKLIKKLKFRKDNNALRTLKTPSNLVDFSSNDYLGFAKSEVIFDETHQFLVDKGIKQNGATGSRLLSGNHFLYNEVEEMLCNFHQSESATIFNSGYDANIGFFSSVPQREDIIVYDELIHASIRDGIQLSNAKAYKFQHNNLTDLDEMLKRVQHDKLEIYVVTESIFSMDGDAPDLIAMAEICKKHNAFLIVDEAHAIGVFGKNGCGLVQRLGIENKIFARIITFGKALGCHGAVVLGSTALKQYLVNFARSFIYTTGLSPHALATIKVVYNYLDVSSSEFVKNEQIFIENPQEKLQQSIHHFLEEIQRLQLQSFSTACIERSRNKEMPERQWGFIKSNSAIHCCLIPGNKNVNIFSKKLQEKGFEVKPIVSPTVKKGKERLRFCLHSYNSTEEISEVLGLLRSFVDSSSSASLTE